MKTSLLNALTWIAIFAGVYCYTLPFAPPSNWLIPLAAATLNLAVLSLWRSATRYGRDIRLLMVSQAPASSRDGETIGLSGEIVPTGEPLVAPFSQSRCCFVSYLISRVSSHDEIEGILFNGFHLTPSIIKGPSFTVKLLAFPDPHGFPREKLTDVASRERAGAFVRKTAFADYSRIQPQELRAAVTDVLTDDDGKITKDIAAIGAKELQGNERLEEQNIAVGEKICAIGTYSSTKQAIVPGKLGKANMPRIYRGDAATVTSSFRRTRNNFYLSALLFFLTINGLVWLTINSHERSMRMHAAKGAAAAAATAHH